MMFAEPIQATPVGNNRVMRLEIPAGLKPGDTFLVTPPTGRVFTVIVPAGGVPGAWIEVVVPDETISAEGVDSSNNDAEITIKKSTAGAAAAGALVGLCLLGPLGAVLGAIGMGYATKSEGKIGQYSRDIGEKTYNGLSTAKNTAEQRLKDYLARNPNALDCGPPSSSRVTNVENDEIVTPTATVRGVPIDNTKR